MKKILVRLILLAVLAGVGYGGYRLLQQLPGKQEQVATTPVRKSDVVVRSFARGELRAVRSSTLVAPNLFGTVQVTRLAPLGSFAREKDLIVEFDDSEVNARLDEKQLEVDQIDEQIKKAEADLAIRSNQDQVELLKANFGVRRSELEVKRNELISQIDAKKNLLNLEEARRRLKQLESDIQSRQEQAKAELAVLKEKKNKGALELAREKQRLSAVKLLSPMSGLVAIKQNRSGGFFFFGQQLPDIREGDQLQPGTPVADVLDLSELEVVAKVNEIDRASLKEGQDVVIQLDAIANHRFNGTIKSMSGTASANVFSADPVKRFDVTFSIDMKQLLSALGARPEQVQKILAAAEQNRRKAPAAPMPGMMMGGPGGANVVMAGGPPPAGARPATVTPAVMQRPAGAAAPQAGQRGPGGPMAAMMPGLLPGGFTLADMARAQLPKAPEEDSQLDVLIRPGLLVDVEIILDKFPGALNVPAQAIFQKDGKAIVYIKKGEKFEERPVKELRRSESTVILAEGVKAGEVIALADPTAKKKKEKDTKGGGPMNGMPVGKGGN